jgi:hypothetical protein
LLKPTKKNAITPLLVVQLHSQNLKVTSWILI